MKELKLQFELKETKEGKSYYAFYVIVYDLKVYLTFTDFTSKRLVEQFLISEE